MITVQVDVIIIRRITAETNSGPDLRIMLGIQGSEHCMPVLIEEYFNHNI